jgi:hypothetical protein
MTNTWADFSGGRPGAAALKAAGFTGVIRYIGLGSAGKLITAAEYADYAVSGVQVLLVVELNTTDAQGGYAAGVANATIALNDARGMGLPDSVGIAAACDEHLTAGQITTCLAYVQGFRDVLGYSRTGAYGFAEFVDAVHSAGLAGWWWKCGNAPTLQESQWVTFWQRNNGLTTEVINKVQVDINDQDNSISSGVVDMTPEEHGWLEDAMRRIQQMHANEYLPFDAALDNIPPWQAGGNLSFLQTQVDAALAPLAAKVSALQAAVAVAPSVTLTEVQLAALETAVTTAVAGLNPPVSATDVSTIAKAVAALLGSKLSV